MKKQFVQLLVRVVANALGLFVAATFLSKITYQESWAVLLIAGFVLALVNAVIRPIVVIFSLPAYIITLGLFSIVVNGMMLYLVDFFYGPFEIRGLFTAALAGIIIGLVNYTMTRVFDALAPENE